MDVVGHLPAGNSSVLNMRAGCIYSIGDSRFLLPTAGHKDVIDVSDPTRPHVINRNGTGGQVAFHSVLRKWVLLEPVEASSASSASSPGVSSGKYGDPSLIEQFLADESFRGFRLWDVSDPSDFVLLSEFDSGPGSSGAHADGCYWDGGRYAYLALAPDPSFSGMVASGVILSHCLVIVDVADPEKVVEAGRWWVPGQRGDELADFKQWNIIDGRADTVPDRNLGLADMAAAIGSLDLGPKDRLPFTNLHGPVYVPKRVEDGGRLGFGSWSALGFLIHDLSDVSAPKVVGSFDPSPMFGSEAFAFHSIWLGALDRGIVVTIPEAIGSDGMEEWLPSWVIDVRNPERPVPIAQLPRPLAPSEAPYDDFTLAGGRFGAHMPPPLLAPGTLRGDFLPVSFFNAGIRCFDLSNPVDPMESGYFVPPHSGGIGDARSDYRLVDDVSIEWDRKLIYAGTSTGVYVLSHRALGDPVLNQMPVTSWTLPGANLGAP